jgi:two-component system nitrogen regulation response regulator NtrX
VFRQDYLGVHPIVPHLTVLSGPIRGRNFMLAENACRIGRDANIEVTLPDTKASRIHVEIQLKDGNYILRDMKSKNGTLVNGTAVSALTLKEGDQIQIGETRLAFSMQDLPAGGVMAGKRNMDSVNAPRFPVGVAPATGSAGVSRTHESFETLELNAPLNILGGQNASSTDPAAPAVDVNKPSSLPGERDTREGSRQIATTGKVDSAERNNRALRALYQIARAAADSKTSTELWKALASGLQTALEADRVTPILLDAQGHWELAQVGAAGHAGNASSATSTSSAAFAKVPVSRTIVDYALRTRRSVLTAPREDERFGGAKSIGEQGITSALCVPIISHEQILGLIYADRLGGQDFIREDQELLTASCLQAAPALSTLLRFEEALVKKNRLLSELKSQNHLLGDSPKMKEVAAFIERAAPTTSVVLVLGESGTGKELVARAIHYNSQRNDAPFIVVNCAALSETLIESELFGHTRGAFTGATSDRAGRFEMAHEGTIFLDEVGELSNNCQTKLLRVLEQGELSRVGEGRIRKVDVRVLAATNRDLQAEVKAGRFREDLFYRLNVLSIYLPPLRERNKDVKLLLEHYLHEAAVRGGRYRMSFSEEALEVLLRYRWPGNVRELRNLTERLAVLCPQEIIGVIDLPHECRPSVTDTESMPAIVLPAGGIPSAGAGAGAASSAHPLTAKLADIEKDHILRVLEACDNNKKMAAEKLGIDRSTLYAKLRAYGILA